MQCQHFPKKKNSLNAWWCWIAWYLAPGLRMVPFPEEEMLKKEKLLREYCCLFFGIMIVPSSWTGSSSEPSPFQSMVSPVCSEPSCSCRSSFRTNMNLPFLIDGCREPEDAFVRLTYIARSGRSLPWWAPPCKTQWKCWWKGWNEFLCQTKSLLLCIFVIC